MYQFDTPYNRKGTNCTKWDIFTDEEMLPMWIADMDFEAPAPIYEAFKKRAAHHVYAYSRLSNEYYQASTGCSAAISSTLKKTGSSLLRVLSLL